MAKKYGKDQSRAVYERTIALSRDGGTTQNLDSVSIPSHNVTTLESHIQVGQISTVERYDWKTGKTTQEPKDVLKHAQSHISTLKLGHPSTSGFRQQREMDKAKLEGKTSDNCCSPCDLGWGRPGSPVPLSGGKKTRY